MLEQPISPPKIEESDSLRSIGYARYSAQDLLTGSSDDDCAEAALKVLIPEFDALPADTYGKNENRFRRHSRAVFLPWSQRIDWLPSRTSEDGKRWTEYYQGEFHPDFHKHIRLFPSVSENVLKCDAILQLIQRDFDLTFWDEFYQRQPMLLGISLIKMEIHVGGEMAFSTPNSLHQDGERFTFAHLIQRENCIGGENVIADVAHVGKTPDQLHSSQIRSCFTLEEPFDSYAIYDPLVSHYVAPICPQDSELKAIRSIMLIDFTPLVSEHQNS